MLHAIAATPLQADFFLTGGTLLAACYLAHRYSDDLDLFTDDPHAVSRVPAVMQDVAKDVGAQITFTRTAGHFLECFLVGASGERLELDFALESPYRLQPKVKREDLGMWVDNVLDIACNKLSALYDRAEPKDFVDIYFVHREILPLSELLPKAKQKHLGLDNYWLAQAFARVEEVNLLPRMIKPLTREELVTFFLGEIPKLMRKETQ